MKTEDDIVELRGGKGAVLRATQRQNDLDSRLVNISKLNKSYMVSQKWNFEGRASRISWAMLQVVVGPVWIIPLMC